MPPARGNQVGKAGLVSGVCPGREGGWVDQIPGPERADERVGSGTRPGMALAPSVSLGRALQQRDLGEHGAWEAGDSGALVLGLESPWC